MKKLLFATGVLVGGALVTRILPEKQREPLKRLAAKARQRLHSHMGRMMEEMPENSPPRLVMSTLPRLAEQNDQILKLLQEQNTLLRKLEPGPGH